MAASPRCNRNPTERLVSDLMHIGKVIKRREDFRLTTGRGRFVDDVAGRDVAHLVFVRSPHGHARLRRISCERAMQAPGVLRIVTAADWEARKFGRLEGIPSIPFSDGRPMNEAPRPAFASGKVRHIGEIVAAVVARSCRKHSTRRRLSTSSMMSSRPLPTLARQSRRRRWFTRTSVPTS